MDGCEKPDECSAKIKEMESAEAAMWQWEQDHKSEIESLFDKEK